MAKITEITIRCLHCSKWFHSPILFGDVENLDSSLIEGNMAKCPHCKKLTMCNRQNIRAQLDDGSFLEIDG